MPNADAAWVDVLPSLAKFTPELKKALGGVMPKAGQQAGAEYARGFTQTAVSGVERASGQLAAARKKEADAAGAVRVAEAKLQDLRESGKAKAAQLVAAEENLAKAKRTLDTQTDAVTRSTQQLSTAQEQAARGAHQLDDGLSRAEKSGGLLSRTMGGLGSSIKLGLGFLVGGGIVHGLGELFSAADESAKIGRLTEQVIRSTGGAAKVSAGQVGDLAQAISNKTGVDDEAIQSSANLLLTFTNVRNEVGKGNDIFNQATGLITDMSVALGKDTSSSAIALGKALNDPIKGVTALQKVGVSFTASQKEQITTLVESGRTMDAQKLILAELGREFGGAAAAAGTPFDKLKVTLGNVAEEVGGYLIPVISSGANFIMRDLIPALRDGASWAGDHFGPGIHIAGEALGFIVDVGAGAVDVFTSLPTPIIAGTVALGAFLLLRGPVTSMFETVALKAMYMGTSVAAATTSVAGMKAAAGGLVSAFGGPVGLAIAGVTIALGFLVSWMGKSDSATEAAAQAQQEYTDALRESNGVITESVRQSAAKAAQDAGILDVAEKVGLALPTVTSAITDQGSALDQTRERLRAYIAQHVVMLDANTRGLDSEGEAAQNALTALNGLVNGGNQTIENQHQLAKATAEAGDASGTAAVTAQNLTTQLEDTASAASDAKQATDLLKTSLDVLTGAHVSMAEAQSSFFAAVAQADGALKNMSGTVLDGAGDLNLQSEAGRKTQDTLIGIADSANNWIATMIQQGATVDEANAKDAELRKSFYDTALQMTGSKEAAERLTNQLYGIPEQRNTQITADTQQATDAVTNLQTQIDNLHGRTVTIGVRSTMPDLNGWVSGNGRMGTFAGGGYTGDGAKFQPKGVVHGGEFVFTKEQTSKAGVGNLYDYARHLDGYAGGGFVNAGPDMPLRVDIDGAQVGHALEAWSKLLEPATGMAIALNWARSQVGKPYIWGSAGPTGYDCSGFMSAITNVIRGKSPYSRLGSTASFPWAGFGPGGGLFTVGSTKNAGGGIGHMAGTLLGTNLESRGGQGVVVGGSARGASSSLFDTRAHLLDTGGLWPPGLGLNETGDFERVLNPPQDDFFRRFVEVAERRADPVGSLSKLADKIEISEVRDPYQAIDELQHRVTVLRRGGKY